MESHNLSDRSFQAALLASVKDHAVRHLGKESIETAEAISKCFPAFTEFGSYLLLTALDSMKDKAASLKEIGETVQAEPVRSFILRCRDNAIIAWCIIKIATYAGPESTLQVVKLLEQYGNKSSVLYAIADSLSDFVKESRARGVNHVVNVLSDSRIREFARETDYTIINTAIYAGLQSSLDTIKLYKELKFAPAVSRHFILAMHDIVQSISPARTKMTLKASSSRQIKEIVAELRKHGYGQWGLMGSLIGDLTKVTGYAGVQSRDIILGLFQKFADEKKTAIAVANACTNIARYAGAKGIGRLAAAVCDEQFKWLMSKAAEAGGQESEKDLVEILGYWGKKGTAYCTRLSSECGAEKEPFREMLMSIATDSERYPDLVGAALKTFDSGGAKPETYRRVRYLCEQGSRDYERLFASKELLDQRINTMLKDSGLEYKLLTEAEKINLLFNIDKNGLLDEVSYINEFLVRREGRIRGRVLVNGFDLNAVGTDKIFGLIPLNGDVPHKNVNPNDLVRCLVLACESPDARVKSTMRGKLARVFGREQVDKAVGSWQRIRGGTSIEERARLYDVFKRFKKSPNGMVAGEVLSAFKGLAREHGLKDNESLSDIINAVDGARAELKITIGETMAAFTVKNKNNAFLIRASHTGCCAFLGGSNDWAILRYAADPAIVLMQFAFANGHKGVEQLKYDVRGVGICYPAITADHRRVFLVDSVEGGIRFGEAIRYRMQPLVETFISAAKSVGAEEVAFYTKPAGSVPKTILRSLVRHLGAGKKEVELKGVCRQDHYLESGVSNAEFRPVSVISVPVKSRA